MDSHLQSNMREHLDLACAKLNSTQVQLKKQRVQLDETRIQLDETRVQLAETKAKLSLLSVSPDGSKKRFIWKIKSFSERMKHAKVGVREKIESDPFYTGCYGYKLKVFASYNGCDFSPPRERFGRISFYRAPELLKPHLSIGIILLEGEYDDILPWPFSNKITFTLIDHNKDLQKRQNYIDYLSPRKTMKQDIFSQRPGGIMKTVESEIPFFIPQWMLQTRPFIVNGALFFQVDIEPDN